MNQEYAVPIPEYCQNFSTENFEMLTILVAIRVWYQYWSNRQIIIKCDNQAVVSVLNSGKIQDMTLVAITRNITMEAAKYDIDLQVIHILGVDNKIADLLSRWQITKEPEQILKKFLTNPVWIQLSHTIANID